MNKLSSILIFLIVMMSSSVFAQTYYIDFDTGVDTNDGITAQTAWKHAPGDANATGNSASMELQPGTIILFKGGVEYQGAIEIKHTWDGTAGLPIVYDGNSAGTFGVGKAIMDGTDRTYARAFQTLRHWQYGGPDYITIRHFIIRDYNVGGVAVEDSSHVIIKDLYVHDMAD